MIDGDSVIFLDEPQETGEAIDASSVIFLDEPAEPQDPYADPFSLPSLQNEGAEETPMAQVLGREVEQEPLWKRGIEQSMPQEGEQGFVDYDGMARRYAENGNIPHEDSLAQIPPQHREYFAYLFQKYAKELGPNKDKWKTEKLGIALTEGVKDAIPSPQEAMGYVGKGLQAVGLLDKDTQKVDPSLKSFAQTIDAIAHQEDDISVGEGFLMKSGIGALRMGPSMAMSAGLVRDFTSRAAQMIANSAYWGPKIAVPEYDKFIAQGVDSEKARIAAALSATVQVALENLRIDPFKAFGGAKGLKKRAMDGAEAFLVEGVGEEALQGAASKMFEGITVEGVADPVAMFQEAYRQAGEAAGPVGLLQFPGMAISLRQGMIEDGVVLGDWIKRNLETARAIAEKSEPPSRKEIKEYDDAGVIVADDFRSLAKRKHLQRQIAAGIQASSVPFRVGQVEALRQDVQPQDAPYQDLPVEQQALEPEQPAQQQFPENQQFPEQENAAQQENPPPTDQAQEPPPAEPQFDGSNVPIDPNYVSARNAMVDSDRELLDRKHPMPSIDKINDAQMMAKVRQSGMVGRASDLAHDIFKNGFPDGGTTVEQETAMVLRRGELRNEYDALAAEMGKISDPVELNELVVKHNNLMERLDEIDYALRGGGTIAAQRLASRKWAYDRTDDFRPVTIVARVKANTGKPLTVKERVEANEWATKIKELEDKVKQLESKTSIDTANKVVEKNRKATERKKRKQAINSLPDAYAKAQELFDAGCLGF